MTNATGAISAQQPIALSLYGEGPRTGRAVRINMMKALSLIKSGTPIASNQVLDLTFDDVTAVLTLNSFLRHLLKGNLAITSTMVISPGKEKPFGAELSQGAGLLWWRKTLTLEVPEKFRVSSGALAIDLVPGNFELRKSPDGKDIRIILKPEDVRHFAIPLEGQWRLASDSTLWLPFGAPAESTRKNARLLIPGYPFRLVSRTLGPQGEFSDDSKAIWALPPSFPCISIIDDSRTLVPGHKT